MKRLLSIVLVMAAVCAVAPSRAADEEPAVAPVIAASNYETFKGAPFFLLSDTAYGSTEMAQVRMEVPGRDYARSSLEQYGGVDVLVYKVPQPLEFLKKQRNLHRVDVTANYKGEGLINALSQLWHHWWKKSRLAFRRLFSSEARLAVTEAQPALATSPAIHRPAEFRAQRQYQPLKGFELVDQFRYPLWQAKAIAPPKEVKLQGSSSEFIETSAGNVMIPVGKRPPGLYLVEAIVGEHRATTLVFVSNTMAITKVSAGQMLVWTARRDNGAAVAEVDVSWTDGSGVLQSGTTAGNGVLTLERGSPEHTYVMGEDADGGVFVSENFYYDSEIYNTKIYAVTDRPLYRPGDEVQVKFMAREFVSARVSQPAAAAPLTLSVMDPAGTPILTQNLQLSPELGADTRFKLPPLASAGGYELRFHYRDTQYGAAFRVAEYVKPHFEMNIVPGKADFKTGEKIKGRIELRYPDGKPVENAALSLTLRAQQNTVVEGELRYGGQFPIELKTQTMKTDGSGNADFELPEAKEPSRYILTVLASDGAAYRVKSTRELMIERSASLYRVTAPRRFSKPGEAVRFAIVADGVATARPVKWEMVQLENQTKTEGALAANAAAWDVSFARPGSYQLSLRDAQGNLVGATSHWVTGDGLKGTPGSIEIVLDRERYRAGDTAEALLTFADPVDQALLTLERDRVESVALLKGGADWIAPVRVAPNQWRVRIPVKAEYGPNITFSVAYTRQGDFVFQNAGLQIIEPRIALQFKTDKEVYQPGEKVTLDVTAQLDGQPVSAMVALGVVDEMIYVLQPEIAPDIGDFFYHPRRNNVRTTASLSFISYDLAAGRTMGAPARSSYNERAVKVLERPRRDDKDTALWLPNVKTDADGRARVTFIMPDSLTRWRITGRAMDAQGRVGQRSGYLRSDKAFFAKWTAPGWLRAGDVPQASVAVFNQTAGEQNLEVSLAGGGMVTPHRLKARRGVNYVHFTVPPGGGAMRLEVRQNGKLVDALDTSVQSIPQQWSSARTVNVPITGAVSPLALPADARNIRLALAQGAASHFARIADDLIEYPSHGVEHTASRLIPLSLAAQSVAPEPAVLRERLMTRLQSERLRLVSMAGPEARFGWWGNATAGNAFMTAYAYYADWHAARSLGIALPPEHWENLLTVYTKDGIKEPLLHRALMLWMAQEMGLPVKTLAAGLAEDVARAANLAGKPALFVRTDSALMGSEDATSRALTALILSVVSAGAGLEQSPDLQGHTAAAVAMLGANPSPFVQSLLMLAGHLPASAADSILASLSADMPTIDRTLALLWVQKKLGGPPSSRALSVAPAGTWFRHTTASGQASWAWQGATVPAQLQLTEAAPAGTVAVVQYESRAPETHKLAVKVERRILMLTPDKDGFETTVVKNGEALRTDALYMDEITLTPAAGARHRYGVLEVPLPPGGSVEAGTWGIQIDGEKDPLERARHESRRDGYAVPVEPLAAPLKVRHLLRFAQKGTFTMPPARYYRTYQPEQKAFEGEGKAQRRMQVE
ncbi:alpha-2-macroglobulin family protein [Massilia sp. PAMC28688]|uniref:alpha-2-macroglobulin family protein n=1 Tax=Massilia sp. PAMC28688 TaxID=2861283 RepID=UPI001C63854F|nr:alpha-2-macroglobulin [Massilia sp. PAMC28688]QYF93542.1 alpha-2-macroglobulin family protein [Massilia sp. PAMC28688]